MVRHARHGSKAIGTRPTGPRRYPDAMRPTDVPVAGVIRLGQFLKLAGLIDSGADAKTVVADGLVSVNGEVELRRGRQLCSGDIVTLGDRAAVVAVD